MQNIPASTRIFDIHDPDHHASGSWVRVKAESLEEAARHYVERDEYQAAEFPCLNGEQRRVHVREQGTDRWTTVIVSGEIQRIYFSHLEPAVTPK